MVYICVICMVKQSPLLPLLGQHRQILEAVISCTVDLNELRSTMLLACAKCLQLIETVAVFQQTALLGVKHLLYLLASQTRLYVKAVDSVLLQVKDEPADNAVEVQSYIEIEAQPLEKEEVPLATDLDIKVEPITEVDCEIEINGTPFTGTHTMTNVNVCQNTQTTSTLAAVRGQNNVAIFTHRVGKVIPESSNVSRGTAGPAGELKTSSDPNVQQRGPAIREKLKKPRKKTPPGPYKCTDCYSSYADEYKLKRHQRRMHSTPEGPYICKICNRKSKNKTLFRHHMYRHEVQENHSLDTLRAELYCAKCEKQFESSTAFRTHMQSVKHAGRAHWKFECDACGRLFPVKARVAAHIQIKHLNVKPHSCAQCGNSYSKPSDLRRHVASHVPRAARPPPPRPHVCHLCAKAFTIKKSLTEHLSMHAGLRPHQCPLCPATFTYSAALYTHNRLKHLKIKRKWKKKSKKKGETKKTP